jgi:hypothetical protein
MLRAGSSSVQWLTTDALERPLWSAVIYHRFVRGGFIRIGQRQRRFISRRFPVAPKRR